MILLTGATGHLGNVVLRHLLSKGETVRAFVLRGEGIKYIKSLQKVFHLEIVYGNVLSVESLEEAATGCSRIIHTAAVVSIGNSFNSKLMMDVNVKGLKNVLDVAKKFNIKKVVYISSIHAFNEVKKNYVITEETPVNPKLNKAPYAKSKAMALEVVNEYRKQGLNISVIYPTGIIGPYDNQKTNNALFPIRQRLNSKSKRVFYFDAGYDFIDVRDVSDVTYKVLNRRFRNEDFIISGRYITLKEIYEIVSNHAGLKTKMIKVPRWIVKTGVFMFHWIGKIFGVKSEITPQALNILFTKHRADYSKAQKKLDFVPMDLKESLEDSVNFINKQV